MFVEAMAGKEDQTLATTYQSDQGETEDEEVKRNCIMGESGMRDSDFFDSDSEMEEEEEEETEDSINDEEKETGVGDSEEDRIVDLVKFVSVGSQILKPKGVVLYRPTPIVPTLPLLAEMPDENDETLKSPKAKSCLSASSMDTRSGFSPRSKSDNDISVTSSSSSSSRSSIGDSDSDSNDGDVESVDSDTDMKSTSLDFPFEGGEELSMEVGEVITNTIAEIEEGSFEDQQEVQESTTEDFALVGASGASVDDKWVTAKQKRVLSSNTLSALNQESDRSTDHPKKMRLSKDVSDIPEITLGIEALDQIIQPLPRQFLVRDESLLIPSCSDEEEDKMLSEELEEKFQNDDVDCSGANSPIPLLTPPQSPRTVDDSIEGEAITSIEWPSNLVMDSAIIKAFTSISPFSSTGGKDEDLTSDDTSSILAIDESTKRMSAPRIRTISVETP